MLLYSKDKYWWLSGTLWLSTSQISVLPRLRLSCFIPSGQSCPREVAPFLLPLPPTCLHHMGEAPGFRSLCPRAGWHFTGDGRITLASFKWQINMNYFPSVPSASAGRCVQCVLKALGMTVCSLLIWKAVRRSTWGVNGLWLWRILLFALSSSGTLKRHV